jgi:hypothetical protein
MIKEVCVERERERERMEKRGILLGECFRD